jgi:hypothetical protein
MVALVPALSPGVQPAGLSCSHHASHFELRFAPLFDAGRGYAFPCDAAGNVDIDGLTDRARANYFYARTTVGRDFQAPTTCPIVNGGIE